MFKDGDQIKVATTLPFDKVCDRVEEILDSLGPVRFSNSGRFTIERGVKSGTWTEVTFTGEVRERKGGDGYLVSLDYEVKPTTPCLVVGIAGGLMCGGLGALVFLFPVLAKGEVEKRARRALDDIEDELNR
jgi:hypothetical protein